MIYKIITATLLFAFLLEVAHGSSSFVRANTSPGQILIKSGIKVISLKHFDKSFKKPSLLNKSIVECKAGAMNQVPLHRTWQNFRFLMVDTNNPPSSEQDEANDDVGSAAHTALLTHANFLFYPAFYRNLFSRHVFLQSLDLLDSVHRPPIALS